MGGAISPLILWLVQLIPQYSFADTKCPTLKVGVIRERVASK